MAKAHLLVDNFNDDAIDNAKWTAYGAPAPMAERLRETNGRIEIQPASGATYALMLVGLRWMGNRAGGEGSAIPTVVAGNLIAFLACLPMSLPVVDAVSGDWVAVAYLGVFQIGAAYLLLTAGIRHVPALEASVLLLLEPALNPVWAWLVHGETPGPWSILGGVLILGATLARTFVDARDERRLGKSASPLDRSEGLPPGRE